MCTWTSKIHVWIPNMVNIAQFQFAILSLLVNKQFSEDDRGKCTHLVTPLSVATVLERRRARSSCSVCCGCLTNDLLITPSSRTDCYDDSRQFQAEATKIRYSEAGVKLSSVKSRFAFCFWVAVGLMWENTFFLSELSENRIIYLHVMMIFAVLQLLSDFYLPLKLE